VISGGLAHACGTTRYLNNLSALLNNTENPSVLLKAYVPHESSPCYESRNGLHKVPFSFSKTDIVSWENVNIKTNEFEMFPGTSYMNIATNTLSVLLVSLSKISWSTAVTPYVKIIQWVLTKLLRQIAS